MLLYKEERLLWMTEIKDCIENFQKNLKRKKSN